MGKNPYCPLFLIKFDDVTSTLSLILLSQIFFTNLLGRRQANLCFHFAGSGENLPDIAKSRDASMGRKQNNFLFQATSCHFSVEVYCTKASS